MSESKRVKKSSIAAFLFMPQFNMCFQGAAHIVPIFIRTLALMLSQSGLIPTNHPALRYGAEGVEKYSFSKLMGEAFFTLRTTRATPNQWGFFIAIIMMTATIVSALVVVALNIIVSMGGVAHAQIFTHPGDPYGAGVGVTDLSAVTLGGSGPNLLFDKRIPASYPGGLPCVPGDCVSEDWALMFLDKVLRQAAVDEGGAFQKGLQGLMQVYNSGVLVVASVILFWMILSIIVDTAATGRVGGGRHNMVWTPIRVVFALGIMFPLGASGFSSGQYMIMKLAEWGSNFGTNGWLAYVDTTATALANDLLAGSYSAGNMAHVAKSMVQMKICQVAYNTAVAQAGKTHFVESAIDVQRDLRKGVTRQYYSNESTAALCGVVIFQDRGAVEDLDDAARAILGLDPGHLSRYLQGDTLAVALENYRMQMRSSLAVHLKHPTAPAPMAAGGFLHEATKFACAFSMRKIEDGGAAVHPVMQQPNCDGTNSNEFPGGPFDIVGYQGQCDWDPDPVGAPAGPGKDPSITCMKDLQDTLMDTIEAEHAAGGAALTAYITGPFVNRAITRGWAGMGSFLQEITKFTSTIKMNKLPEITFTAPELSTGSQDSISLKVKEVLAAYDKWWLEAPKEEVELVDSSTRNRETPGETQMIPRFISLIWNLIPSIELDIWGDGLRLVKGTTSSSDLESFVQNALFGEFVVFDLLDLENPLTFPMVAVTDIGASMIFWGSVQIMVSVIFQAVVSMGIFGTTIPGLGENALVDLAIQGMNLILFCGFVISFYLPALPLIRVAFSVLTWITSVFEAVVMIPMASLSMLASTGEGLTGGKTQILILWLNVLMRPILTVIGFVGAILIYNAFLVYFHLAFAVASGSGGSGNFIMYILKAIADSIIYMGSVYTAMNTIFKLIDIIPNAMMRWMGGSADTTFEDSKAEAMVFAAGKMAGSLDLRSKRPATTTPAGASKGSGP